MEKKENKTGSFIKMYKAYSDNLQKSKSKAKKLINSPHKKHFVIK